MPPLQCSSAKMIAAMKELFAEHGIPEIIRMDNGPQFGSHLYAEFTKDWNIDHKLTLHKTQEAMAKLNQLSKLLRDYSPMPNTQDRTPTLPCWPTEVHLLDNSAKRIRNRDPHAELGLGTTQWLSCFKCLISWLPLPAQVTILHRTNCVSAHDAKTFWLPAMSSNKPTMDPTWLEVISRGRYRQAWDHTCEQHPKAEPMRKDTSSPCIVAPTTPEWPEHLQCRNH